MLRTLARKALLPTTNSSRVHLEEWAKECGATLPSGSLILDAGAGEAPYRQAFSHLRYETADFQKVDRPYAEDTTYVCDLSAIPVDDGRFDRVFCSQVLEHMPDPQAVMRELHRVVKPGGTVWMSAPLFYEEHEIPFDFYRYTQYGWRHLAGEAGFEVESIKWLEGYYGTLGYQLNMGAQSLPIKFLPVKVLLGLLAKMFMHLDVRSPVTNIGMCKNYAVVLLRPT